ncbi:hypothetical protein KP509_1Z295400 [Ceratopteris richardii]|nr:hypothetical protein KP509_1Z295400 [Ceratopteris richardii]
MRERERERERRERGLWFTKFNSTSFLAIWLVVLTGRRRSEIFESEFFKGIGAASEEQKTYELHLIRLIWFILWVFLLFVGINHVLISEIT